MFLVPRDWGIWRLFAERAVVVDNVFPFHDEHMKEWYDRYLAIYDTEQGAGYPSGYPRDVTESELRELQGRYGFHYAVLPAGSNLPFRTVAVAGDWKLVRVVAVLP